MKTLAKQIVMVMPKASVRCLALLLMVSQLSACKDTVVGAAVDAAIDVAKVPFNVGGAPIDVATPYNLVEMAGGEVNPLEHEQPAVTMDLESL